MGQENYYILVSNTQSLVKILKLYSNSALSFPTFGLENKFNIKDTSNLKKETNKFPNIKFKCTTYTAKVKVKMISILKN